MHLNVFSLCVCKVGLEVDHEAIPKIIDLNQSLLDKMANSDMPESAQYRINVTKIANYRIQVCNENLHDPEKVEELIACGQVEELVEQAKDEHDVLDMYLNKRYWEIVGSVDNVEPEVEIDPEFSETDTEESAKQSS